MHGGHNTMFASNPKNIKSAQRIQTVLHTSGPILSCVALSTQQNILIV